MILLTGLAILSIKYIPLIYVPQAPQISTNQNPVYFTVKADQIRIDWSEKIAKISEHQLFVDGSNGNDDNDGETLLTAFKTIQKCADAAPSGSVCLIRGGVYRETVIPAHDQVIYRNYNQEKVTVTGADLITGWLPFDLQDHKKIYRAHQDWNLGLGLEQIIVDGKMMVAARWPNISIAQVTTLKNTDKARSNDRNGGGHSSDRIGWYNDSDLKEAGVNWQGGKITFAPGWLWNNYTCDVTNSTRDRVDFQCPFPSLEQEWSFPGNKDYFFLWGKYQGLDYPGEFFQDPKNNNLFLWTADSSNPNTKTVESKKRNYWFVLDDRSQITIEGINFIAGTFKFNNKSNNNLLNKIKAKYVGHYMDIALINYTDRQPRTINIQGHGNQIINSELSDSSTSMIFLDHGAINTKIANNIIYNVNYNGTVNDGAIAGIATNVGGNETNMGGNETNEFGQNTVFNSGYNGVMMDSGLDIKNNDVYNTHFQGTDSGAISMSPDTDGKGLEVAYNYVHDAMGEIDKDLNRFGGHGIYADIHTKNFLWHHNVIWHNSAENLLILTKQDGQTGLVYHNTSDGEIGADGKDMDGLDFKNNLAKSFLKNSLGSVPQSNNYWYGNNDPKFVDSDHHDYRLLPNSPAKNIGQPIQINFFGKNINVTGEFGQNQPDVGAFEGETQNWVAGAIILPENVESLKINCVSMGNDRANCDITNLPMGRKIPAQFQMNGFGEMIHCINITNYTTNISTGKCSNIPVLKKKLN